jgi:hypothetical protein
MEQDKIKNLIRTTIRKFLNEQMTQENDKPPMMGTQYNQVNIFYNLTNNDFSYAPSSLEYWDINTDRTLLGIYKHYSNEEEYQKSVIQDKDWFLIYYGGKRYSYNRHSKILRDRSNNKIKASLSDDVFRQQMNQIIHNTLNPSKPIDVF